MTESTVVLWAPAPLEPERLTAQLAVLPGSVRRAAVLAPAAVAPGKTQVSCQAHSTDRPLGGAAWNALLSTIETPVFFTIQAEAGVELPPDALARLAAAVSECGAGIAYSDYREITPDGVKEHATIDYQLGSVRDSFDFGPVMTWNTGAVRRALQQGGPLQESAAGGLYELRLRVSQSGLPLRVPEMLYTALARDLRPTGKQQFDYVDPRNQTVQREYEDICTQHLKRSGAYLEPRFAALLPDAAKYPVEASVVIPVRNRERTIADAVRSVLEQQATFAFNVIVTDNHSTDATSARLAEIAAKDARLVHLIPERRDLGIGGCWNHAVCSPQAGRYVVQLDSDDLYDGKDVLQRIVDAFAAGPYAMVVGSYRLVNFDLQELPPGVIDHREWTRDNGRNNLLRVNGLGAPRAFRTDILRRNPISNVSYGEDYGIGLRISREYEIGRIYEPLYLCRRWEGNSDADLPLATKNRYDTYKDRLRTMEIMARQQMVASAGRSS